MKPALFIFFSAFSLAIQAQDLYSIDRIPAIKIEFNEKNWKDILDSLKRNDIDTRLIGLVNINGVSYDSVGVRYKGNSSFHGVSNRLNSDKLPFNIKADAIKKEQTFMGGYTSLKLSNAFLDPSLIREVLSNEIAGKYMPAPRANFAKLYVNDEYLGLYSNIESIDEKFLTDHFNYSTGSFFKCESDKTAIKRNGCLAGERSSLIYVGDDSLCYIDYYEIESKYGWKNLVELIKILNRQNSIIDSILNVDQTLWMLAFNNVFVNLDSYIGLLSHNYYLFRDSTDLFTPLIWDLSLCFGGFDLDGLFSMPLSLEQLQKYSPILHFNDPKRPLISSLLSNPFYKKVYLAHYRTIVNDYITNGKYYQRAKELNRLIDELVKSDSSKLYSYEDFKTNLDSTVVIGKVKKVAGISELMTKRYEYLSKHPLLNTEQPQISGQNILKDNDRILITVSSSGANKVNIGIRERKTQRFESYQMFDDGQHGDVLSGDTIFVVYIKKSPSFEYYFFAESDEAVKFLPERAAFEYFEWKE